MPRTPVRVVIVPAIVDRDFTVVANRDGQRPWVAATAEHTHAAFRGLSATGETFAEARLHLAEVVALAARNVVEFADLQAVRILALTRKTFPVDTLNLDAEEQTG